MNKALLSFLILILLLLFSSNLISSSFSEIQKSCECVAFRLDDIQDGYLSGVNMQIIRVFEDKNVPLAIGIVGNLFGQDKNLTSFIKSRINMVPELTITNHGWNHEDFRRFNINDQTILIKRTNDKINNILGIMPSTFIPPFNVFNNDTLIALRQNGIKYLSSATDRDPGPYIFSEDVLPYHIPSTAFTGSNNETYWYGLTHQDTLSQIKESIKKYGFAVVGMHPYEYSDKHTYSYKPFYLTEKEGTFQYKDFIKNWDKAGIDWDQIKQLELLIDQVNKTGYKILPIEKMPYD